MRYFFPITILIVVILFGSWTIYSNFFIKSPNSSSQDHIVIATTIFPLTDIARNIGGSHVKVVQLLPPGASPHSYELTPQQVVQIQNSQALFLIGHGIDNWATKAITSTSNTPAITVDEEIDLRSFNTNVIHEDENEDHNSEENLDPHYWLTAPNAQKIATTIAHHLQEIDPDHAADYEQSLQYYTQQLETLEVELQETAQHTSQKNFITMHNAWSYFADQYGLHLVGSYEPTEGHEPSLSDLQQLRNLVQQYNITAFYSEPQKKSISALEFLHNELGLQIKTLDAEGNGNQASYIDLMRANMHMLQEN